MKLPKTIRGYLSFFDKIESDLIHSDIKGFDKLPKELQDDIREFDAAISNHFLDINEQYKEFTTFAKSRRVGRSGIN